MIANSRGNRRMVEVENVELMSDETCRQSEVGECYWEPDAEGKQLWPWVVGFPASS